MKQEIKTLMQELLRQNNFGEKEREILRQKAIEIDQDLDELDIFLDAELQKNEIAKRQNSKQKLCPYCGSKIENLEEVCPACGHLLSATADEELSQILDHLEEALVNLKSRKNIAQSKKDILYYSQKGQESYQQNPKIKNLLRLISLEVEKAEEDNKKSIREEKINATAKNVFVTNRKYVVIIAILLIVCGTAFALFNVFGRVMQKTPDEAIFEAIYENNTTDAIQILEKSYMEPEDRKELAAIIACSLVKNGETKEASALIHKHGIDSVYSNNIQTLIYKACKSAFRDALRKKDIDEAAQYTSLWLSLKDANKDPEWMSLTLAKKYMESNRREEAIALREAYINKEAFNTIIH